MISLEESAALHGDDATLEVERERFLREFKSQFYAQRAMRDGYYQQALYELE